MLKYFKQRQLLNIEMNFSWRNSYIAIIDKCRNFIYEKSSPEKLSYNYNIENIGSILIESAGFDAGNESKIIVNNGDNLSKRKRGLNIVLLNSKTLEVIDSAYCDTFADKELKVYSNYFDNIKIKNLIQTISR